jgi:hypothetical protein
MKTEVQLLVHPKVRIKCECGHELAIQGDWVSLPCWCGRVYTLKSWVTMHEQEAEIWSVGTNDPPWKEAVSA